jgi:hypothetical protein
MNRRSFFVKLGLGIAATPTIVKAAIKADPFTYRRVDEWQPAKPQNYNGEIVWYYWKDEYGKIPFSIDKRPLRFTIHKVK